MWHEMNLYKQKVLRILESIRVKYEGVDWTLKQGGRGDDIYDPLIWTFSVRYPGLSSHVMFFLGEVGDFDKQIEGTLAELTQNADWNSGSLEPTEKLML